MILFLVALLVSAIGVIPLVWKRQAFGAGIVTVILTLIWWLAFWWIQPSSVWPLWGLYGLAVLINLVVTAVIAALLEDGWHHSAWIPIALALVFTVRGCSGCSMFRADDYASMLGKVETRVWTQDVQPKDPNHIRLVPRELASWLANKQLGEAGGVIGSQFDVSTKHMTIQRIKGELWYVAPLDFEGFTAWTDADVSPGYVMVHAEDPERQVIVKTDQKFKYMPNAYWGSNLERHLRNNGYRSKGLTDYSMEIDEEGQPWWVVTVFKPTIAYAGEKVTGVVIVNPTDGSHAFHEVGKVPEWVDRVFPKDFVKTYIADRGKFSGGWINSWWGKKGLTEPEEPSIVYGSDGQPYWVTGITSTNEGDESLIGLMYTNSRTGKTVFYKAVGGTDAAVLEAVNNKVRYKRWHGASPVLYNIYGTMASIVPLLGESHTFQGVAIVNVNSLQVAVGKTKLEALREYQKLLATSGQKVAPVTHHNSKKLTCPVSRFAPIVTDSGTRYYLYLSCENLVFSGTADLSPKLPLTQPGDEVTIEYIDSKENVVPILSFENASVPVGQKTVENPGKNP